MTAVKVAEALHAAFPVVEDSSVAVRPRKSERLPNARYGFVCLEGFSLCEFLLSM